MYYNIKTQTFSRTKHGLHKEGYCADNNFSNCCSKATIVRVLFGYVAQGLFMQYDHYLAMRWTGKSPQQSTRWLTDLNCSFPPSHRPPLLRSRCHLKPHLRWPPPTATRPNPSPPTSTTTDSPIYPPPPPPPPPPAAASPRISTVAASTGPPCAPLRRGGRPRGQLGLRRRVRRVARSSRAASSRRGGSRGHGGRRGPGLGIPRSCRGASSRRGGSRGRSGSGEGLGTPPLPRPALVLGPEGSGGEEAPRRRLRRRAWIPARVPSTRRFPVKASPFHGCVCCELWLRGSDCEINKVANA